MIERKKCAFGQSYVHIYTHDWLGVGLGGSKYRGC